MMSVFEARVPILLMGDKASIDCFNSGRGKSVFNQSMSRAQMMDKSPTGELAITTEPLAAKDITDYVRICYVDKDGIPHNVDAKIGDTLMATAKYNLIAGIDGDCGGNCACGTCRIRLPENIAKRQSPADDDERDLLSFLSEDESDIRLGCQIQITQEFEGVTITVAHID